MASVEYEYSQNRMGTTVSLKLFEPNETAAQTVFNAIKLLEDKLTVNRPKSELMSVNQAAGKYPVKVSPAVFALIKQAQEVSLYANSCFNLAIGPLVKLWKIGFQGNQIPTKEQIEQRLQLTNPHDIKLDANSHAVFLQKAGMEIDLGAIAKGYIADVVKTILNQHKIYQAIINLGGNVFTLGESPINDDGYWQVGLKKPFSMDNELVGIIKVKDKSVVTSGIYERFFVKNERIYHHIFNPKTGYPLDNELESVTIISNTSLEGDIYSTILYGLGVEKGKEYLKNHQNLSAVYLTKSKTIKLINPNNFSFSLLDDQYKVELG
ncbi:FAD:protein FMN transferase [Orbaceae bacterium ac157xtp]